MLTLKCTNTLVIYMIWKPWKLCILIKANIMNWPFLTEEKQLEFKICKI